MHFDKKNMPALIPFLATCICLVSCIFCCGFALAGESNNDILSKDESPKSSPKDLAFDTKAEPGKRVAMVMVYAGYTVGFLRNPVNDSFIEKNPSLT